MNRPQPWAFRLFLGLALLLMLVILGLVVLRLAGTLPIRPPAGLDPAGTASLTPPPSETPGPTATVTPIPSSPTPLPPEGQAFSIGQSVEGRDLLVVRFGNGPIVRMIIGGIHGGYEWNTVVLAQYLIADLREGRIVVHPDVTLYILPNLNPDGYYNFPGSSYGRPNANQVDLNRNWDSHWAADWPRSGCFGYIYLTAGPSPFSEPETRALSQFLLDNRVDALISYHSQASTIYAAGSSPLLPASDDLARKLAAVSGYLYPPPPDNCLYTGQLVDWAADHGIAALTIELTSHESSDLAINRKVLEAFLDWRRP